MLGYFSSPLRVTCEVQSRVITLGCFLAQLDSRELNSQETLSAVMQVPSPVETALFSHRSLNPLEKKGHLTDRETEAQSWEGAPW